MLAHPSNFFGVLGDRGDGHPGRLGPLVSFSEQAAKGGLPSENTPWVSPKGLEGEALGFRASPRAARVEGLRGEQCSYSGVCDRLWSSEPAQCSEAGARGFAGVVRGAERGPRSETTERVGQDMDGASAAGQCEPEGVVLGLFQLLWHPVCFFPVGAAKRDGGGCDEAIVREIPMGVVSGRDRLGPPCSSRISCQEEAAFAG